MPTAAPTATPEPTPEPTPTPEPVEPDDDALTRAYVEKAIAYYSANGRDATAELYNSTASVEGTRVLFLMDAEEQVVLAYQSLPALVGQYIGPGSFFADFGRMLENATAEGYFASTVGINPDTGLEEPRRFLAILYDGLVFAASHSVLQENLENPTREYVERAIAKYERDGLDATIAYYNSQDSLDGQFYLFLVGADDNYLVHPIFPHLIGADIKDVVGSDGDPLGERIALAPEEGIWVEYLWPHPISRVELPKVTLAIRHDGLIFASGYYAGAPEAGVPPWQDADPREYTVQYVERAIERYERDGLESMLNYYNSVASFEGEWYLFATDENDIYHVHPLIPRLVGVDIKDVVGSDGYELGKELAKAGEGEGVWVEYLWPHPVTLKEVPKVGYAVRKDGMIFASGYYPGVEDPAAHTKAYVQKAMDYYDSQGLDAAIAWYSSPESLDGQWSLTLADENDILRAGILLPHLIGTNLNDFEMPNNPDVGKDLAAATEEGRWVTRVIPNTRTSETQYVHIWAIRYDGLFFMSQYYNDQPNVPGEAQSDDALTRAFVEEGIARFERYGLDATLDYYNSLESVEGERTLMILRGDDHTVLASAIYSQLVGINVYTAPGTPLGIPLSKATPEGHWITDLVLVNPATGQRERARYLVIRHTTVHEGRELELIFASGHFPTREEYAKNYVQTAINFYDREGLDAAIDLYNSQSSIQGEFYLFLIGADDLYLAHPILPHLIGTDIKDVADSSGYELGKEIAKATEAGHWVDYLWPNPATRIEEPKSAWVVRHNGLIFASGYYTPDQDAAPPAWTDADPIEYTMTYVDNAIARYERDGLEAFQNYYNSVGSFEGQWYLFAMDANDHYILHPIRSDLIGTDVKNVVDSTGKELGKEIAQATEDGVWVEYLWPHPFTLQDAPKVAYAKRHDGLIFASGYYPVEDPRARTQEYVADAIAYYESEGREAAIEYYNSQESIYGQWSLTMASAQDGEVLANGSHPNQQGDTISEIPDLNVTESGKWLEPSPVDNPLAPEAAFIHIWAVLHDGIVFMSGYYSSSDQVD